MSQPSRPPSQQSTPPEASTGPRLLIVTGLSGAGRSTVADTLEDIGWYVADNLPPELLPHLYRQVTGAGLSKFAVVLDVRTGRFFDGLSVMFDDLSRLGVSPEIVFLEASDEAIVRRQESVRRPVPLQGGGRLLDGIRAERRQLAALRAAADVVIDTSDLNVHQLSARVAQTFGGEPDPLRLTVLSFGFKNGLPVDADIVLDARFLPNPHWVPELRPLSGLDPVVSDYVLRQPGTEEFLQHVAGLVRLTAAGYLQERKRFATVAIGCTGGKHRSTALAVELARRLDGDGLRAIALHRDLGME